MDINKQITVMQAFANGKRIESKEIAKISDWEECLSPSWNFEDFEYRIKPKQLRKYTLQELLSAIKIHGLVLKYHEEGYVDSYYTIVSFTYDSIGIIDAYDGETQNNFYDYYISEKWSWADDGSPIGIVEIDESM